MRLTWMPPRKRKYEEAIYPEIRHWLVDDDGRIQAQVIEPKQYDPEDCFEARLHFRTTDDEAYFISLEHAQAWAERETQAYLRNQCSIEDGEVASVPSKTVLQEKE